MLSVPRFIGGLAAACVTALVAMPTAQAAGGVAYTDTLCSAFYTDPAFPPPNQVMVCAKLYCSVTTNVAYLQPVNSSITMTVSCTNPPGSLLYQWALSPQSPATCPPVPAATGTTSSIAVASPTAQTCWYEAITKDSTNPTNTGWARYGLKWQ